MSKGNLILLRNLLGLEHILSCELPVTQRGSLRAHCSSPVLDSFFSLTQRRPKTRIDNWHSHVIDKNLIMLDDSRT